MVRREVNLALATSGAGGNYVIAVLTQIFGKINLQLRCNSWQKKGGLLSLVYMKSGNSAHPPIPCYALVLLVLLVVTVMVRGAGGDDHRQVAGGGREAGGKVEIIL